MVFQYRNIFLVEFKIVIFRGMLTHGVFAFHLFKSLLMATLRHANEYTSTGSDVKHYWHYGKVGKADIQRRPMSVDPKHPLTFSRQPLYLFRNKPVFPPMVLFGGNKNQSIFLLICCLKCNTILVLKNQQPFGVFLIGNKGF